MSSVSLGKWLNFSEPHFSQLWNIEDNPYFTGFQRRLNEIKSYKNAGYIVGAPKLIVPFPSPFSLENCPSSESKEV